MKDDLAADAIGRALMRDEAVSVWWERRFRGMPERWSTLAEWPVEVKDGFDCLESAYAEVRRANPG